MINIQHLAGIFNSTISRFPWVILISIIGCFCGSYLLNSSYDPTTEDICLRIVLSCIITAPLQIAYHLKNEIYQWTGWKKFLLPILLIPLVYLLMERLDTQIGIYKFFAAFFTTHLFLAFAIFYKENQKILFWEMNQIFLTRFAVAVLYSLIIYAGISIALLSIDVLLNVKINNRFYGHLFIWTAGFLNTLFFLSGLPKLNEPFHTDSWNSYPLVLKILVQYILLPLVTIYLGILYLYILKILIEWNIPKGWVSYLVLCFSIAGILSLLLIEPLKEQSEHRWIKTFYQYFYLALLPLIVLLFVSIGLRIWDYGFTVPRYYVFILALWLTFITFYFLFSPKKNIQTIPISLFSIGLISFLPPFSADFVSEYSQLSRLERILTASGALKDGKIKKVDWKNQKEYVAANRIASYLLDNHSYGLFHPWLEDTTVQRLKTIKNPTRDEIRFEYIRALGFQEFYDPYLVPETEVQSIFFYSPKEKAIVLDGKHLILRNMELNFNNLSQRNQEVGISILANNLFQLTYKQEVLDTFSLEPIKSYVLLKTKDKSFKQTSFTIDTLSLDLSSKTQVFLRSFDARVHSDDSIEIRNLQFDMATRLKQ